MVRVANLFLIDRADAWYYNWIKERRCMNGRILIENCV